MTPRTALLARARAHAPIDPGARDCWGLIVHAIELGWLDDPELEELIDQLGEARDVAVDELVFAHVGGRLRVSLLDDHASCAPAAMLAALAALAG